MTRAMLDVLVGLRGLEEQVPVVEVV